MFTDMGSMTMTRQPEVAAQASGQGRAEQISVTAAGTGTPHDRVHVCLRTCHGGGEAHATSDVDDDGALAAARSLDVVLRAHGPKLRRRDECGEVL